MNIYTFHRTASACCHWTICFDKKISVVHPNAQVPGAKGNPGYHILRNYAESAYHFTLTLPYSTGYRFSYEFIFCWLTCFPCYLCHERQVILVFALVRISSYSVGSFVDFVAERARPKAGGNSARCILPIFGSGTWPMIHNFDVQGDFSDFFLWTQLGLK